MITLKQTETFKKWWMKLRDERARALVAARLDRLAFGLAGDAQPIGNGISELRIHYGPGYRIYYCNRGTTLIILLCGGEKSSQENDIKTAKRLSIHGEIMMNEKITTFDPAELLTSDKTISIFMADALESGDVKYIAHALGVVARARGMSEIAKETGLSREQLYRSFSEEGNPTLKTTLAVMKALKITLTAKEMSCS
jgi:putative addiction module killer protein/probable addiction module antidote protein